MSLSKRYTPSEIEDKWYAHWLEKNYFHSEPDERAPYTIVIPPPNVTGVLHMGHMLNNTIQDILIRKARKEGKNACWVPGTDHASIATEAKVVKLLREKGIKKSEIGREEFLKYAFEWKEKYGGIILEQLKRLGASCDWQRTRFTMEPSLSRAVIKVFVDQYRKGRLYRGLRMTNWDPVAKTVLSNEEVIYTEEASRLYHLRYRIEGEEDAWLTIATTRPETILGDTAVAVHPEDERYQHLKGKRVLVPLIGRSVPIIFDTYVEREFGTGALKVTPAHDVNDYEIGQRHQLEVIDIFNEDATMSQAAQLYIGMDRFEVRELIVKDLEREGHLVKVEEYVNKVGRSERTQAVVEPRLSLQWFLKMDDFARTALEAVRNKEVRFFPEHFWNMYYTWLREENVRDWCISRQLWWGQRIPAWYYEDEVFVAETAEEALEQARKKLGKPDLKMEELRQDEDVVDTWFSSWLWPITVFDGFERQDELRYYYPTNALVTGWDIMFFWVARMIMSGYEYSGELLGEDWVEEHGRMPFRDVFFTGMVRDNKRRKMSKSLGNSPDALELINRYGADSVRFGLLSSTSAGNDIIFDAPIDPQTGKVLNESALCEQGRNFSNKMWNALRLVKGWELAKSGESDEELLPVQQLAVRWLEHKFNQLLEKLENYYEQYRLSDAIMDLYSFIWNDFCSWYLEMVKPPFGKPVSQEIYEHTLSLFERMMSVLHPFMPFVTEEIWHQLRERGEGEDCVVSPYPRAGSYDKTIIEQVDAARELISKIRDQRNAWGLKNKDAIALYAQKSENTSSLFALPGFRQMVSKLAHLSSFELSEGDVTGGRAFLSGKDKYFAVFEQKVDVAAERAKLEKELEYYQGFVASIEKKLSNEKFVNNAPAPVVERERKKLADGLKKIRILQESLQNL